MFSGQRSSVKIVLNLSLVWPPVLVLFNSLWTWLCSNFCQSIWLSSSGWCFALPGVIWYTFILFFRTFAMFFPQNFPGDFRDQQRSTVEKSVAGWAAGNAWMVQHLQDIDLLGTDADTWNFGKKTRFSQWFSQGKRINEQLIHFSSNNFKLTIIVTFTDWCKWFLKWTTRIFFFVTWKLGFVPQKQKQAPGRFFWTLTSQNPCVPDCQQSNYFTTEKKEELCFFFSVSLFWAR